MYFFSVNADDKSLKRQIRSPNPRGGGHGFGGSGGHFGGFGGHFGGFGGHIGGLGRPFGSVVGRGFGRPLVGFGGFVPPPYFFRRRRPLFLG